MEAMRDVLRDVLGRSLKEMPELDRLAAAWPVACGRALAGRGVILGLEDGVLQVEVADAAWMGQWNSMRGVLAAELTRIARVPVGGIHFRLRRGDEPTR